MMDFRSINPLLNDGLIIFYMIGLIILIHMLLKVKDNKIMLLLISIITITLIVVPRPIFLFHILAALLLAFIAYYYYNIYAIKKHTKTLLVMTAFILLFLGHMSLVFAVQIHPIAFTIGRVLQLIAYLIILFDLVLILKK